MLKVLEKLTAAFLAVFLMLGGTTSAEAFELFTNSLRFHVNVQLE
jgi:hypothetical protein